MACSVEGCRRKESYEGRENNLCYICWLDTKNIIEVINEISDDSFSTILARYLSLNLTPEHYQVLIDKILNIEDEGYRNYYLIKMCKTIQSEQLTKILLKSLEEQTLNFNKFRSITQSLTTRNLSKLDFASIEKIIPKTQKLENAEDYLNCISKIYSSEESDRDVSILIEYLRKNDWRSSHLDETFHAIISNINFNDLTELFQSKLKKEVESINPFRLAFVGEYQYYLFELLLQRFPNQNWKEFWEKNKFHEERWMQIDDIADIIARYGSIKSLDIFDLYTKISTEYSYNIERAKRMVGFRNLNTNQEGSKNVEVNYQNLKFLIKDGYGYSTSRFYGFYMGLSKGSQPSNVRRSILNEIIQMPLVYENGVSINKGNNSSKMREFWNRVYYLVGNGNHSDWEKRISSSEEFMLSKPWHPWGYYAYEILNKDRLCLLKKYGPSTGILPVVRETNLSGIIKCDVIDIFGRGNTCPICDSNEILPHENGVQCWSCKEIICEYGYEDENCESYKTTKFDRYEFDKKIFGKIIKNEDKYQYNYEDLDIELTSKDMKKMDREIRKIGVVVPIFIRNHLAPMYADTEEMSGVGGDPIKRHFIN